MAEKYEVCEIKGVIVDRSGKGFLSLGEEKIRFYILLANLTTGKEMERTETFEVKSFNITPGAEEKFQSILNRLYSEGWEVAQIPGEIMTDAHGLGSAGAWIKLKRKVTAQVAVTEKHTDDNLTNAAWKLREAGLLTSEEFESVMLRLQNRK